MKMSCVTSVADLPTKSNYYFLLYGKKSIGKFETQVKVWVRFSRNVTSRQTLFRNKRFMLNEMIQYMASKFAIFLE